jgi:hypothetical protein
MVGGVLALAESGLLLSTARSAFGGDSDRGGVRTAAFDAMTFVTGTGPVPILVDENGRLLETPDIQYRAIPRVTTTNVRIQIDRNQVDFASLFGSLEEGEGTSPWFEDRELDPRATFEATPNITAEDGSDLVHRPIPKQLQITRLPLTAETRDRQIEIRFAVPAEASKRFALHIFLASGGDSFPATPTLQIPWEQIQAAYKTKDQVFDDLTPDGTKWQQPFVIREIQRVEIEGIPALNPQKAYALDAIFNGYPRYRVRLVEEGSKQAALATVEGQAGVDADWAEMLNQLTAVGGGSPVADFYDTGIRLASTAPFSMQLGFPLQPWHPFSGPISRATLSIREAVGFLKDDIGRNIERNFGVQLAIGFFIGFWDGVTGDFHVITSPIETYRQIRDAFAQLAELELTGEQLNLILQTALSELGEKDPFELIDLTARLQGKIGFLLGYLTGMIVYQVASALAIGALAAGIGAVVVKVGTALRGIGAVVKVTAVIGRALAALARVIKFIVQRIGEPLLVSITEVWRALDALSGTLAILSTKYKDVHNVLEAAYRVMARSVGQARQMIELLARIAGMPDELAARLLDYMAQSESRVGEVARWLSAYTKRTQLLAGVENNRAAKEALEATPQFPNQLADELNEVLVAACDAINRGDAVGADNLVRVFAQKYTHAVGGNRLEDALRAFRRGPDDTRFTQNTINEVIRVHAENTVATWLRESLEGSARIVQENGDEGATILARLIKETDLAFHVRLEEAAAKVNDFTDPESVRALGRLVQNGESERTAMFLTAPGHSGIEERLINAVDELRYSDGSLIPGVSTKPQGRGSSPLLNTLRNATNRGFAYEPVGVHKMVARGEFTLDEMVEMGRRFDVDASRFVEADAFVVRVGRRSAIDFKFGDVDPDGLIDQDLLDRVALALTAPVSPFDEWVFAVSGNIDQTVLNSINDLNQQIRNLFPDRFTGDPIRVVSGLGGF